MKDHPISRFREWSLKKKLFGYMLLLVLLILIVLTAGLSLFDRFDSVEQSTYASLDVQMEVFGDDITNHFDALGTACISLSRQTSDLLEQHLQAEAMTFSQLTDSQEQLLRLQEVLLELLEQQLFQVDCSGVFALLDTTVNTSLPQAEKSRSGLYLQTTGYDSTDREILLLRGFSQLARENGMMPHRKWRLEFRTDLFPDYEEILADASLPLDAAYRFSGLYTLPGTSDEAVLLTVPIRGSDGSFYGVCGFEVSASYFMTFHVQPTKLDHLTCLVTEGSGEVLDASSGLSCGGSGGYYRAPRSSLAMRSAGGGLIRFTGGSASYIGVTRRVRLSPNNAPFTFAVMMPKADYDRAVGRNILQNTVFWLLLIFFAVSCCLYFSRRFLTPILKDLEQIKSDCGKTAGSHLSEISDLFAFLADQDRAHEEMMQDLVREKEDARKEILRIRNEYELAQHKVETAQAEIARLAYSRKTEVDPDDYKRFLAGIDTLTAAERRIFDHYLDGRTVKEIIAIAGIKESTLRYHNQNIYSKLGVNSLKQLLRYAALMRQQETETPPDA